MLRSKLPCLLLLLTSCQQTSVEATSAAAIHVNTPEEIALGRACPVTKTTFLGQAQERKTFTIVGIGSSSMEGVGASAPQYNFLNRLDHTLSTSLPGVTLKVINAGIGGQNLMQTIARFPRDVYWVNPDLVILQAGMNDAIQSRDTDVYRDEIKKALEDLSEHNLNAVLMSNQYAGTAGLTSSTLTKTIDQINKDEAIRKGIGVIDRYSLFNTLRDQGIDVAKTYFADDLLHANDEGYRLVTTCTLRRVFGLG
ncbi:SGNH/GDSL hydrolase family protein [Deinococcus sp. Leaf326]|uniref:SGNH/GDSL hydrolase family protein n=1 Tax=Deinococcus sp. Leaf326 TaxID=1736338 RepID=UPI000AE4D19A|nr:SGNH/GDSL hydrolase family protein [Deinococcus sp. Leaf326]